MNICRTPDCDGMIAENKYPISYQPRQHHNSQKLEHRVPGICGDLKGAVWFAAEGGVSRYDGERFVNLTTEDGLVHNSVRAVHCGSDGVMWFGTHGGVSRYDGKQFVSLTTEDGLVAQLVYSICSSPDGVMWFGTNGGISRYDGREFVNLTKEDGLIGNAGRSIHCDPSGTVWFGVLDGASRYDGKTIINFTSRDGLPSDAVVGGPLRDSAGKLWFGTYRGVSRYDEEAFMNFSKQDGLPSNIVRAIHRDSDGGMWIGTFGGISHYDGKQFDNYSMEERQIGHAVNEVLRDASGILWVGTEWGGISRYDGECFTDFASLQEGGPLPHPRVTAIYCDPSGVLWFGTGGFIGNGGLVRYDGKDFATFIAEDGLPSDEVLAICGEADGTMWIGTTRGLSRYDGKCFTNATVEDGLVGDSVSAIYCEPNGALWFGTGEGVSRYDRAGYANFTTDDGLTHGVITAIHRTSDGMLWFASHGGGVSMYDGVAWSSLDTRDGLAGDLVRAIDEDTDGSVWFATDNGLARYRRHPSKPKTRILSVTTEQTYTDLSTVPGIAVGQRVTIEYAALDYKTIPEKQQYRCRIKERGQDWSKPTRATRFDCTFDRPGAHTFEVQAIDRDLNYSKPTMLVLNIQPDPMLVELNYLRREVSERYHFDSIVGHSAAIRQVRALMERAIDSGLTVLIIGETGTGKELVAKAIHYNSQRKDKPLLDRNCGAMPRELLANDLFGHCRGAFTGATEDKMGLFEAASGGTLLLDEIGEMPEDTQIHLLRVLQERKIQRLGEYASRDVDVRIIAMTNRDLGKEVGEGRFREDLYYRLSEFPIRVPPLRERKEDIPFLVEHFLKEIGRHPVGVAPGVLDTLQNHSWPGNVRELRNIIRRAAALAEEHEPIQIYHFPPEITHGESMIQQILSERAGFSASVNTLQRRMVEEALQQCNGNRSQAAKILNIHRPSLIRLMKRFGIE